MKFLVNLSLSCACLMAASLSAGAEPITGKDAKKALFAPQKAEIEVLPEAGLPEDQVQVLQTVGESQPYYGAVAISPAEGLLVDATVVATNFHDSAAAAVAALAECNAKRKADAACIVAAYIRPKGWKDNGFSLSSDATTGFKDYDMKTGALAVSVLTGAFGLAAGDAAGEAAVAACAAKNKLATDCAVVVEK